MNIAKTQDGTNLFKSLFDFNLFKLIQDNFSNHYTVCLEIYFQRVPFYSLEFNSFKINIQKLNMNIDKSMTKKVNSDYKYFRSILNLSPDGTSQSIQRRLYIEVECIYDNKTPSLLPIYVVIHGTKNEAKNDLDFSIYDYYKSYDIINETTQMHIPIDMNGNDILKTTHYLHGYLNTNTQGKTFTINGCKNILLPSLSIIKQVQILYNSFKFYHKTLNNEIYYGPNLSLSDFFTSSQTTQIQAFNTNITILNNHFRVKLINKDAPNEDLNILIKYIH